MVFFVQMMCKCGMLSVYCDPTTAMYCDCKGMCYTNKTIQTYQPDRCPYSELPDAYLAVLQNTTTGPTTQTQTTTATLPSSTTQTTTATTTPDISHNTAQNIIDNSTTVTTQYTADPDLAPIAPGEIQGPGAGVDKVTPGTFAPGELNGAGAGSNKGKPAGLGQGVDSNNGKSGNSREPKSNPKKKPKPQN